jgi:RNA polymerase sigma-70 factor, ECF subfamily
VETEVRSGSATSTLIASCLGDGSEAAWGEFVSRFQPLIASVILRSVRRYGQADRGLVDDLVQETFLRLCKNEGRALRQFQEKHEAAIFGFLKVIAISVATDHFRSIHAQKRVADWQPESEEVIDTVASTPPNSEQVALMREIQDFLDLETNQRDKIIFWLYYRQGFTARDIATLPDVGLTEKGVESSIYRLTKAVRAFVVRDPT